MSLSFSPCSGSSAAPAFLSRRSVFVRTGMPWDFMGSNGNLWVNIGNILFPSQMENSILWSWMLNLGGNGHFTRA